MRTVESIRKGGRHIAALLFFLGAFQIAGYYLAGALVRSDGGFAVPQPDTMLYCQAARRIAEGHPLSFSAGEAPTTGTTSHLYPFVLAVPYALGARGDALFRAGFLVHAGFYLIYLFAWGGVIRRKCPGVLRQCAAAAMVALFGQSAFSVFSQTDIGFWMATSALLALGLAKRNPLIYGPVLAIGPWVRPEGMYCVLGFGLALAASLLPYRGLRERARRVDGLVLALGIVSALGVFVVNFLMTGSPAFSSLAHKGHLATKPLGLAVYAIASDLMTVVKPLFFGIPAKTPRDLYFIPLVGAVLMWIGVLFRNWRASCDWRELAWYVAAGGGVLSVALSGMQDMNMDRYLAWIFPTLLLFMASGAIRVREWLSRAGGFADLPLAVLVSFAAVMAVVNMAILEQTSRHSDLKRGFAARCDAVLPPGASLGTWGSAAGAYELGERRMAHLSGIYSRPFMSRHVETGAFEKLKHEAGQRFDFFLALGEQDAVGFGAGEPFSDSEPVLVGPGGCELRRMDWSSFSAGALPPRAPAEGMSLRARVDVAYDPDEQAAGYRVLPADDLPAFDPFYLTASNRGVRMTDCGRVVLGGDEMRVALTPGKDAYVVLRTTSHHKAALKIYAGGETDYTFANPLRMNVAVDGVLVEQVELAYADKGFSDVSFRIPGSAIVNPVSVLSFLGDHIACGYWFYQ